MKSLVFAAMALIILGGCGAGAYYYFGKPAEASVSHNESVSDLRDAHKDDHENLQFVELDPLFLPVVDDSGASQMISLIIAIEVSDSKYAEEIEKIAPRLKDAFIQDLYGAMNSGNVLKDGIIQVPAIKGRLSKVSNRILGSQNHHEVLIQVIQQRPL